MVWRDPIGPPGPVQVSPFGKGWAKEAETLAKFKGRIDQVLTYLEASPAAQKKIDEQTITRAAYGSGALDSANALSKLYDEVHDKLKTWSKIFGDQLEAMGITALIAEKGIDGVDAEQRRRLEQIQIEAQEHYRIPKHGQSGGSGDSSHDSKSVGPDAS
ncbi:hypothetical protein ABZ553_34910 [Streptomyces sparsogenes]|uniref:hypothetical protein n=1 Tax=Streptomyces sparsogenes TaxID=67365 RepID=UPI003402E566